MHQEPERVEVGAVVEVDVEEDGIDVNGQPEIEQGSAEPNPFDASLVATEAWVGRQTSTAASSHLETHPHR